MTPPLRNHWSGLLGGVAASIAAAFLIPLVVRAPELNENRTLAPAPQAPRSWSDLRASRKAADAYVADHFPARPHLIGAVNFLRLKMGVRGSSRVVVGRDGWLFYDDGTRLGATSNGPALTDARAREWLAGLAGRREALERTGATYLVVAAPTKETVYPDMAPDWYRGPDPDRPAALLARLAARSGAGEVLYLNDALRRPTQWGMKTYSPHDTHWTGLGAYYGYAAIMRRLHALGRTEGPRPIESFADVGQDNPYKPKDLALMLGVASFVRVDYPELGDPEAERRATVTWLTSARDWKAPRVINTGEPGKPVLLIIRDSFATALLPFLYSHFSRIVVVHNEEGMWREDLMARYRPDVVMLEVVESGAPWIMRPAPPASGEALRRIDAALAEPHRTKPHAPPRRHVRPLPSRTLRGGPGPDRLKGSFRREYMTGGPGDDEILASGGADVVRGGQGDDRADGGWGDDWISGDKGADTIRGGRGADVFVTRPGAGVDRVLDFSAGQGDRVVVEENARYDIVQRGADTVIRTAGAELVLVSVQAVDLPDGAISSR